ncbi:MAG: SPOR domain-containing protein [Spirochaetales bacterium]|nr:SPOR domain-containing protein [Spirochaetales bacterium]
MASLTGRALYTSLLRLAEMEELLGNLDEAQRLYLQAAYASPDERDYRSMLISAAILIEIGGLEEAEMICRAVISAAPVPEYREKANILLSQIMYLQGDEIKSWELVETALLPQLTDLSSSSLLWVSTLANLLNKEKISEQAKEILLKGYPQSPEAMITSETASVFPSPIHFFGLLDKTQKESNIPESQQPPAPSVQPPETTLVMIQTGSFQDPENAAYHVKDLSAVGFEPVILEKTVSGKLYHRVVIPNIPQEEVQRYLLLLKDKGYEGWPIYE